MIPKRLHWRHLRLAQRVKRPRQQHGDGSRGRQRPRVLFFRIFHVIGRQRPVFRRQGRPAQMGQLLGAQLYRQTQLLGDIKDARDLLAVKSNSLAEPVHRINQPLGVGGLERGDTDLVQIGIRAILVFRRHRMGTEECGPHPYVAPHPQCPRRPQHPQLGIEVETIARLHLDHANAFGDQRVKPRQRPLDKRRFIRRPRVTYSRNDAAPGAGDLLIARAIQPHFEFQGPVATKNQMRVAIDQRRGDQPPAHILGRHALEIVWNGLPNMGNHTIPHRNHAMFDHTITAAGHRRDPHPAQNSLHHP